MHSEVPMEPVIQRGMTDMQIGLRLRTGYHPEIERRMKLERRPSSGRPDSDHLGFVPSVLATLILTAALVLASTIR